VAERRSTATGPGRILIALYAIFAVGASSRAVVQLATRYHEAPIAYLLSAFAAVVYVVATFALARTGNTWWWVALAACTVEFAGMLIVGTISILPSTHFPDSTVWSVYGRGYLFIPTVLPLAGLLWLWRVRRV